MSNILNYQDFLNEAAKQSQAGKDFEEMIGGILKDTDIIRDVKFKDGILTLEPDGKLGKMDVSLIVGLLQDTSNIEKMKDMYKGLKKIQFEKMTLDI